MPVLVSNVTRYSSIAPQWTMAGKNASFSVRGEMRKTSPTVSPSRVTSPTEHPALARRVVGPHDEVFAAHAVIRGIGKATLAARNHHRLAQRPRRDLAKERKHHT